MATPRYSALSHMPPPSDDGGEGEGEGNHLLSPSSRRSLSISPSATYSITNIHPRSASLTFLPSHLLRIFSSIFCFAASIVLIICGREWFIAADLFLLLIVAHNLAQLLFYFCSFVFRIRIEYHGHVREHSVSRLPHSSLSRSAPYLWKLSLVLCIDLILCLAAFISILGENARYRSDIGPYWFHQSRAFEGTIVAYVGLIFHVLLAIPKLDQNTVTLSARLDRSSSSSQHQCSESGDVKFAPSVAAAVTTAEQRQDQQQEGVITEATAPVTSAEDIV